eukprot:6837454-Alexandrium_andersonii.AAC.1
MEAALWRRGDELRRNAAYREQLAKPLLVALERGEPRQPAREWMHSSPQFVYDQNGRLIIPSSGPL